MGISIEDPDAKIVRMETKLPVMPKEEARRYRQMSREAADVLMVAYMKRLAEIMEGDDLDLILRAGKEITRISMSGRSNEDLDVGPVIDVKVLDKDPVADLEKATEKTGEDVPE